MVEEKQVFRGALLVKTQKQTVPIGVTTPVEWESSIYDTNSFFHSNGFLIPSGVNRIRLQLSLGFDTKVVGSLASRLDIATRKNEAVFVGMAYVRINNSNDLMRMPSISSAIINVEAGDYFDMAFLHNRDVAVDIANEQNTWFAIEVID